MSRRKLKGRDKVALKNSRDGAVERNLTSGEDVRISKRETELDLRGGKPSEQENLNFSQVGKSSTPKRKQTYRHNRAETVEPMREQAVQNTPKPDAPQTAQQSGNTAQAQPKFMVEDEARADEAAQSAQSGELERVLQQSPRAKSKPPPNRQKQYQYQAERRTD